MTKKDAIIKIHLAKAAHMRWKNLAQISIGGLGDASKISIPILQTESEFGKWYYGEGMNLSMLSAYMNIEGPLEEVFNTFIQIFTIQRSKKKDKGGMFGFFGNDAKDKKELDTLIANFNIQNKLLIEAIHALELEIMKMSDLEYAQYVSIG